MLFDSSKYSSHHAVWGFIPEPLYPLTGVLVSLTRYIPQCWGLNSSCRMQVLLMYAGDFSITVTKYPSLAHGDGGFSPWVTGSASVSILCWWSFSALPASSQIIAQILNINCKCWSIVEACF